MILLTSCIFAAACAVLAFTLHCIYGGFHSTLEDAKPGNVYSFDYLQPNSGTPHRHIVKVLEVQDLSDSEVKRLNARSKYRATDPAFKRGNTLVRTVDTEGRFRQFYAERAVAAHWIPFGSLRFRRKVVAV